MSFGESYLLKRVLKIIDKCHLKHNDVKTKVNTGSSGGVFSSLYATGCQLDFCDTDFKLSIQTNPDIAGWAFCETAILSKTKKGLIYPSELGYGDVVRHEDEEMFEGHLEMLFRKLPTFKYDIKPTKGDEEEKIRDEEIEAYNDHN